MTYVFPPMMDITEGGLQYVMSTGPYFGVLVYDILARQCWLAVRRMPTQLVRGLHVNDDRMHMPGALLWM